MAASATSDWRESTSGTNGMGTVKISPPLVIPEDAVVESVDALEEAFAEALHGAAAMV